MAYTAACLGHLYCVGEHRGWYSYDRRRVTLELYSRRYTVGRQLTYRQLSSTKLATLASVRMEAVMMA